jgi:hypothetical protein
MRFSWRHCCYISRKLSILPSMSPRCRRPSEMILRGSSSYLPSTHSSATRRAEGDQLGSGSATVTRWFLLRTYTAYAGHRK